MSHLPYAIAIWIFLVALYGIVTSRNLVHLVVCLQVAQSSTYVLLLAIGYRTKATAPIFNDIPQRKAVDPVVQALTLTDVVVGVTVAALLLALAVQAQRAHGDGRPRRAPGRQGLMALTPLPIALPLLGAAALASLPAPAPAARRGRASRRRSRPPRPCSASC